ncbi:MAG TPA: 50S ribosomal protein L15 [Candidatus Acidoferrales bacterium]|nr:50S ribosomal protein L15 [Candidatus Acidoferrales bacterium]
MDLSNLKAPPGASKKRKRVGRGDGSGHGKTSGRGHKGSGARAGGGTRPGFEGGQMPLARRLPKRGFHNPCAQPRAWVNLGQLEIFAPGTEVTPELLVERGLVRKKNRPIKVLADGTLTKPLTVKAHAFSAKAREKIISLGGTAEVIARA